MYAEMTLADFCEQLGSKAPVPGGGGAAGLVGAVGAGLGQMVCSLTAGKPRYAEHEDELEDLIAQTSELRAQLLASIDEDARCFEPLSRAYGIPKEDPSRPEVLESALRVAAQAPCRTMGLLGRAIELVERISQIGSPLAISDAGVAAVCCKAALQGAALNVYINTRLMADRAFAAQLDEQADSLLERYEPLAERVYEDVKARLR